MRPVRVVHRERASVITVSELGEFGLIKRVSSGATPVESTLLGPGDDAAVIAAADGRVVISTDLLVENRHFRRDWSTGDDVGHKAVARCFADIAAMGAVPTALVVGFAAPGDLALEWVDGLISGMREECGGVGAAIVGGDVTAADAITLAMTGIGDLQGRAPVTIDGARPGDSVAVAGRLGWAAAGFAVLNRGFRSPVQVVTAHRRPEPPYAEGPIAADAGASAMTDVSDGLVADLGHIATASGVRIELSGGLIDLPAKLAEVGAALNVDPLTWVLTGGDDYALVATFPHGVAPPPNWQVIGAAVEGDGVRVDGRRWPVGGFEHFRQQT
ncbi:MAG TPA: thiamine-phosphate kinase [Jatrophihabitantaceae bacterium]|nr:thiamine-phosphate kinase [Jatrophihabitantaceae bacterium]